MSNNIIIKPIYVHRSTRMSMHKIKSYNKTPHSFIIILHRSHKRKKEPCPLVDFLCGLFKFVLFRQTGFNGQQRKKMWNFFRSKNTRTYTHTQSVQKRKLAAQCTTIDFSVVYTKKLKKKKYETKIGLKCFFAFAESSIVTFLLIALLIHISCIHIYCRHLSIY